MASKGKDVDVNVSSEEENLIENLWISCKYVDMSVCRIVTMFIKKAKEESYK